MRENGCSLIIYRGKICFLTARSNLGNLKLQVQGSLLDTEVYSAADLEPPSDGKMRTVTIGVGVVFEVVNASDGLLASATLSDSAEVQITDEAYTASQYGQASGSGSLTISGE